MRHRSVRLAGRARTGASADPPAESPVGVSAGAVSSYVEIGPLLERTEDASFYEGGTPGRSVGDTLYSRSGLFLADDPDVRVATKATVGVTFHRSNGSEFTAQILETVTFVDGSSLRCTGPANLSAFERFDADIVLEAAAGTGALWGWMGQQVTRRTKGAPSQARRTWFRLESADRTAAGSGPIYLPPVSPPEIVTPPLADSSWSVLFDAGRIELPVHPAADAAAFPFGAGVFIVAADVGSLEHIGRDREPSSASIPLPDELAMVLAPRLKASQLPTGGATAHPGAAVPCAGFLVLATPYGLRENAVRVHRHGPPGWPVAAAVEVPQAGGPAVWTPLTSAEPVRWGIDRGLLECIPLGVLADALALPD